VQRGQNATSNSRHCPRRTPIRERRTRLRARTPACAQARHEVAVNFTTDRTVPRHCSGRGYDVKFGQGTGGDGKGLRPRGVEPHSPSDCFTREVSVTFHHWPGFPRKSAREPPPARQARSPRNCQAGGISDRGMSLSRRRNRSLHHPACFYFVSFALRASKSQLTRSEDALKQSGSSIDRSCPLSDLCVWFDKFRRPFFRRCFEDAITLSFRQEEK
jgi:hypothetical protein